MRTNLCRLALPVIFWGLGVQAHSSPSDPHLDDLVMGGGKSTSASSSQSQAAPLPFIAPSPAQGATQEAGGGGIKEFRSESEKDFPLRSIGRLQVTNSRGAILLQGWAHDKIRIKVVRVVQAPDQASAEQLSSRLDYRLNQKDGNIEIASQYGKDLSIDERLKESNLARVSMNLQIWAPSHLKSTIWGTFGEIQVKNWGASLDIRSRSGGVEIENSRAEEFLITCRECAIQANNLRGSLRCTGGGGRVDLSHIDGKNIFIETNRGEIYATRVKGTQIYLSSDGKIEGQFLTGKVDFKTKSGPILFKEVAGSLSGRSEFSSIQAHVTYWDAKEKMVIESDSGQIQLSFPRDFSSEVDIWSIRGQAKSDFPIERAEISGNMGPQPFNRLEGRIRQGGELLKVLSNQGDIYIRRGQ